MQPDIIIDEQGIHFPASNHIDRIKYLGDQRILEVEFKNHQVYHYMDVPESVYEQAKEASSIGLWLNTNIKGKFEYKKI